MKPTTKYILIGSAVILGVLGIVLGIRQYQKYKINKVSKTKEEEEEEKHIFDQEQKQNDKEDLAKDYRPTQDIKYIRKYLDAWGYEALKHPWGTDRKQVADKLMSLNDAQLKKLNQWYNSLKNPKFTWRLNKERNLYQQLTHAKGIVDLHSYYDNILKRMLKLKLS